MKITIPKHIGFVMDGNGRWATKRGLPRKSGHREGVKALKRVIRACAEIGVEAVTFFAFSTENWNRPKEEIDGIFSMVTEFGNKAIDEFKGENLRLKYIGDQTPFNEDIKEALRTSMEATKDNTGMLVCIALNYGGRADIAQAAAKVEGKITEDEIEKHLYTAGMPPLDVVVRSAGEKRLSNFMLFQAAYSELIFLDDLWPDFDEKTVNEIVKEFSNRSRRFGGV